MKLLTALSRECGAEVLKAFRAPEYVIPTLALPVAFYTIFGVLMNGGGSGGGRAAYLLATYGVFAVMGPAMFGFGVGVAMERDRGWLDLKRVAPMPAWVYLVAKLFAALIFSVCTLSILYSVGGWAGGVSLPRVTWTTLLSTHLAVTIPFSLLGLSLGFLLKGNGAVAVTNILYLGLSLVGGLWMPLTMFPGWLRDAAQFLPSFHAGQTALGVVGMGGASILDHLTVMALFTVGFGVLALMCWALQKR